MSLEKTREVYNLYMHYLKISTDIKNNLDKALEIDHYFTDQMWGEKDLTKFNALLTERDGLREQTASIQAYLDKVEEKVSLYHEILFDIHDGLYNRFGKALHRQLQSEKDKRSRRAHDYSNEPIVCYMLTFTLNKKNVTRHVAAERLIRNIPLRTSIGFEILEMRLVRETHKSGAYHWHVGLQVRGIVKKDRFKGYIDSFGNVDIKRQKVSDSLDGPMSTYCSKENPFEIVYQKP